VQWVRRKVFPTTQREHKLNRQAATPFYEKGDEYFYAENLVAAKIEYERALDLDPEFSEAYLKLGLIAARSGQTKDAIQAFTFSLKYCRQQSPLALTKRGTLLLRQKSTHEKAKADFEAALKIRSDLPDALFGLGLLEGPSSMEKARDYFLATLQHQPNHLLAYICLAQSLS